MFTLTDDTFKSQLAENKFLIVKFSAKWCGPCKALKPLIAKLETEWENVTFAEADIDDCPELLNKFEITSVPRTYFFKDGVLTNRIVGVPVKSVFDEAIKTLVNS